MEDKKQVIVRPIIKRRPWVNTDTFTKNKLMGAGTSVAPYVDQSGILHTGMNAEEQAEMEKELQLEPGTLDARLNNPFWDDYVIRLEDEPNTFNPLLPRDKLKIYVLKAHKLVANSLEEQNPDTDFYIEDVDEIIDKKVKEAEAKEKAYSIFSNMTDVDKRAVLKLYGKGGADLTDKAVKAELMSELEKNVPLFISNASQGKDVITIRAFIFDLHHYGVIRTRGDYYYDGDSSLGTISQFGEYLLMPDKQDVYDSYKARLEQAKFGR